MTIWIITTGEQLPEVDGSEVRLWRSVMLTNVLNKKGIKIIRWTSCINHTTKEQRFEKDKFFEVSNIYTIVFLKTPGYKKNISIKRIHDHRVLANKFKKEAAHLEKPDLILCSLPTIELCYEATIYGKQNNIPVVLDGRDMWPDIFIEPFPKLLKPLASLLLFPLISQIKEACKNATALSGISEPYVRWELRYANREKTELDKSFPHGYSDNIPDDLELGKSFAFWDSIGIKNTTFNICLFSAMGNVIDIEPIIDAAIHLKKTNPSVKFVLCGDGVKLKEFQEKAINLDNIIFTGWVHKVQIWTLMRLSKVGILPYKDIDNYKNNIPNKPIEYLSAGLPILSGVSGLVKELIENNCCGFLYRNGEELSNHINLLFENQELYKNYSRNALKLFNKEFTAEKVYDEMANYLINIATDYKK